MPSRALILYIMDPRQVDCIVSKYFTAGDIQPPAMERFLESIKGGHPVVLYFQQGNIAEDDNNILTIAKILSVHEARARKTIAGSQPISVLPRRLGPLPLAVKVIKGSAEDIMTALYEIKMLKGQKILIGEKEYPIHLWRIPLIITNVENEVLPNQMIISDGGIPRVIAGGSISQIFLTKDYSLLAIVPSDIAYKTMELIPRRSKVLEYQKLYERFEDMEFEVHEYLVRTLTNNKILMRIYHVLSEDEFLESMAQEVRVGSKLVNVHILTLRYRKEKETITKVIVFVRKARSMEATEFRVYESRIINFALRQYLELTKTQKENIVVVITLGMTSSRTAGYIIDKLPKESIILFVVGPETVKQILGLEAKGKVE